jgi:hypothetical protein
MSIRIFSNALYIDNEGIAFPRAGSPSLVIKTAAGLKSYLLERDAGWSGRLVIKRADNYNWSVNTISPGKAVDNTGLCVSETPDYVCTPRYLINKSTGARTFIGGSLDGTLQSGYLCYVPPYFYFWYVFKLYRMNPSSPSTWSSIGTYSSTASIVATRTKLYLFDSANNSMRYSLNGTSWTSIDCPNSPDAPNYAYRAFANATNPYGLKKYPDFFGTDSCFFYGRQSRPSSPSDLWNVYENTGGTTWTLIPEISSYNYSITYVQVSPLGITYAYCASTDYRYSMVWYKLPGNSWRNFSWFNISGLTLYSIRHVTVIDYEAYILIDLYSGGCVIEVIDLNTLKLINYLLIPLTVGYYAEMNLCNYIDKALVVGNYVWSIVVLEHGMAWQMINNRLCGFIVSGNSYYGIAGDNTSTTPRLMEYKWT